MRCQFESVDAKTVRCIKCHLVLQTSNPPEKCFANCNVAGPETQPRKQPCFNCEDEPHIRNREAYQVKTKKNTFYQVGRAVHYAIALVKHTVSGEDLLPLEVIQDRFSVCKQCDQYIPDALEMGCGTPGACSVCGCCINNHDGQKVKNKLAFPLEICPHPDGPKWNKIEKVP